MISTVKLNASEVKNYTKVLEIIPKNSIDNDPCIFIQDKSYKIIDRNYKDNEVTVRNDHNIRHTITLYGTYCEQFYFICEDTTDSITGMTSSEQSIMDAICQGHNKFLDLESQHPCEMTDFVNAIHTIQGILAMRVVRRNYPEYWLIKKGE